MTKTTLLRTLACVVGVLACVTGVASPSYAARTPVPVPSAPVSNAPDTPLLPGREVKITAPAMTSEISSALANWA